MTLAQVQFGVAIVATLIASWMGLVMSVALSLPGRTAKAEAALETTPKRCFGYGLLAAAICGMGVVLFVIPSPISKLVGLLVLLSGGAAASIGAAGLARLMGRRIGEMSGARTSFGALAQGSLIYSVGLLFPLIGWYVFAPLSTLCALGAGIVSVWPDGRVKQTAPGYDIAGGQAAS